MSDLVFTGTGDPAHDRRVVDRARRYAELSEVKKRTDRSGEPLRRIVERVYTTNLRDPLEAIVRRSAWQVLGHLYPGLVISARSAAMARVVPAAGAPNGDGFVFMTGPYRRNVSLPGLQIRITPGPGALPGDIPFCGLHLASPARHCLENLSSSRDRGGVSRTTGPAGVERFLTETMRMQGEEGLNALRDQARDLVQPLNAQAQFAELSGLIAALLRSRDATVLSTPQGKAIARSEPFDERCVETLDAYFAYLASNPMPNRPDEGLGRRAATNTAFVEAYFSNFIEGTTFLVEEAKDIIFNARIPANRPKDGRDILSTYQQLAQYEVMARMPTDFADFVAALKGRHANLMSGRPELNPGVFKNKANRAGNTLFVEPDLVEGTLRRGHELLQGLSHPFARAAFCHFLVSAVHPFDDGNGRLSRILMACELTAGGLARIVVPTVYRDDYLGGQRALTRRLDAGANFRALDRCQAVTAAIVDDNLAACLRAWGSTHAFVEPGANARLTDPSDVPLKVRDGVIAPESYWQAEDNPTSVFGI